MDKPTIGHYASHQRDVTAQEDSALNAALRSSTVKVEHPEIARLRAELADKTKRLDRIATLLTENEPGTVYYGLDDDVGDHGCCGLLSYKPHAPDCWFMECRALAAKEE